MSARVMLRSEPPASPSVTMQYETARPSPVHFALVLAHGIGVAEIEVGAWDGNTLRLRTESLRTSPTAKPVTALERDFELDGDTLRYTLRMSTTSEAPRWHLSGELHRAR